MSKADELFQENCRQILSQGTWDTDLPVRPRWEDGTPAHTIKLFGLVNRYDLREEFPIQTIRRMYLKSAVDELLWIWQKKSNNIHDLNSSIWDAWADETFVIGGESLYRQTLDRCDTVYVTKLHRSFPGADRFFPNLDQAPAWVLAEVEGPYVYGDLAYTYCTYRRREA